MRFDCYQLFLLVLYLCVSPASVVLAFAVAASSGATSSLSSSSSVEGTASKLLKMLQAESKDGATLDNLVGQLIAAKVQFDPDACIDGPFYCTCYVKSPTTSPLWERIGGLAKDTNRKGQMYRLSSSTCTDENEVVNYSEILGPSFYLKAVGTFDEEGTEHRASASPASDESSNQQDAFGFLRAIFGRSESSLLSDVGGSRSSLCQCPYTYNVTITGASIHFGDDCQIRLPVQGTACTRVLYADPNMRIFISPQGSKSVNVVDKWEEAGLVVVQVRTDVLLESGVDSITPRLLL